jgi:hypothetical protein
MTELDKFGQKLAQEYSTNGNGYLILQKTKVWVNNLTSSVICIVLRVR